MSLAPPARKVGLFQVIDWRLVAAVGLPLWAFLIGYVIARAPAPVAAAPPEEAVAALPVLPPVPEPVEPIPMPREVVYRTEVVTVPVPVPVPGEPAVVPVEFKLPPSEVVVGDRCKTFDTRIRFHPGLPEAAEEAKQSKKLLLVLHISGNFDDPGFT
jgi:hypothetical protein